MARRWIIAVVLLAGGAVLAVVLSLTGLPSLRRPSGQHAAPPPSPVVPAAAPALAGSQSCRECHQRFYELWSTSHHGLAMQPFTPELARTKLTPMDQDLTVGKARYRVEFTDPGGVVRERGPDGEQTYPILHALGGKNVFYFLTTLDRGRLQTLPVAYDVRRKEWFDTSASAMRHFPGLAEQAVEWRDPLYTFNTSCHACHVSQLSTNYDLVADRYHTTWAEPGINCETCHGPSGEHVKAAKALPPGQPMPDLRLISTKVFTVEQHNDSCSTCHAKASVITATFRPGDRFFDHFDLVTYESPDYHPDGRDLGENYTFTSWRMNPCANTGKLSCVHCHTSSGRYRFKDQPNHACLPCHAERVQNAAAHTHHKEDSPGNQCIACHMPTTEFARMRRSDHSLLPPVPAATIAFKSPNACNLCHTDKDAAWSDAELRKWRPRPAKYHDAVLHRAALVAAARQRDWSKLPDMLAYIADPKRDETFATSLIRLLHACPDERKWPVLIGALKDQSPLVRSAAAAGLTGYYALPARQALLAATQDEFRLVRIRAAAALAALPREALSPQDRKPLEAASAELVASLQARPDDWASHYNLGNHYLDVGDLRLAVQSFEFAHKLRADAVMPLVNLAMAHARLGDNAAAERALTAALKVEPANAAAHLNFGLLKAELGDFKGAEEHLRAALKADPALAQAAYNLGVLLAKDRLPEAVAMLHKAAQAQPAEPRYAYTLAFYLAQAQANNEAADVLQRLIRQHPAYIDAYRLLGAVYEKSRDLPRAAEVYRQALSRPELSNEERQVLEMKLRVLGAGPVR